jgi:hypothetical protein
MCMLGAGKYNTRNTLRRAGPAAVLRLVEGASWEGEPGSTYFCGVLSGCADMEGGGRGGEQGSCGNAEGAVVSGAAAQQTGLR